MRATLAAVAFALTGCAQPAEQHVYRGVWEYGFEHNRFREVGIAYGDSEWGWCLSREAYDTLRPPQMPPEMQIGKFELALEGELSPRGHYGHMGVCERELRITRLLESRHIGFECYYDAATCERFARGEFD